MYTNSHSTKLVRRVWEFACYVRVSYTQDSDKLATCEWSDNIRASRRRVNDITQYRETHL